MIYICIKNPIKCFSPSCYSPENIYDLEVQTDAWRAYKEVRIEDSLQTLIAKRKVNAIQKRLDEKIYFLYLFCLTSVSRFLLTFKWKRGGEDSFILSLRKFPRGEILETKALEISKTVFGFNCGKINVGMQTFFLNSMYFLFWKKI